MPLMWLSLMNCWTASDSSGSTRHLIISYMDSSLASRVSRSASSRSRISARLEAMNCGVGSG